MSFARLQKIVTYLLAALGMSALTFGGELPVAALALLGAGFVASWFVEGALLQRAWWSRFLTVALCVALAGQIARGILSGGWLGLAMEFAGLLSISRLANRRSAADYQQIAMLAFIQLIAATVLTTDVGYAGVFIAFVIATPWVLTLAHLRREIERNYPAENDVQGGVDLARVLASRRIVDVSFLLWIALLSLPMLAMTAGVFVLFPRVGLGMLNVAAQRGQHMTGFGNDVELGGFGVIRDDPTVVVRVVTPRKLSVQEARRILRLRGTAFDHYDGKRWTRSPGEGVRMTPLGEYYPLQRMEKDGDLTLKLILDRLDEPVLFVPRGAVGLRLPERGLPGTRRARIQLTRGHGLDLRYAAGDELGVLYEAVVSKERSESDVPVDRELEDESRYLSLPAGHERVIALARQLTEGLTDPYQKVNRLQHYLRDEQRFTYSLELPDTRGKLPLETFLFAARRGHCEYFSSALAVMLRAVGIPSRNVTGFLGGEYNTYGGYYGVRNSDAHSWVEALLPERGWVVLDPTPAARESFRPSNLFRDVREIVDALRAYWMTRVVSYDLRKQVRGLRELREFFRQLGWGQPAQKESGKDTSAPGLFASRPSLLLGDALLVGALLGAWLWRRRWRRQRGRELAASAQRAQALYRELERELERLGHARPLHVPPEAHARALHEAGFVGAREVDALTQAYLEARYGERVLERAELDALRARLQKMVREQRAA